MKTNCYSLFDVKAAVYGSPFFMPNDSMALRVFSDLAHDKNTMVAKHPEDFILFRIGTFDDAIAVLDGDLPVNLATAASLIVERQNRFMEEHIQPLVNGKSELVVTK